MQNESGIRPIEYKVLIKPDPVEEKTSGGIIITDELREREQQAQVKGTLIAWGGKAFSHKDMWSDDERSSLFIGSRVFFNKFDGLVVFGADDEEYRLCNDKDIGAIIEKEGAFSTIQGRKPGLLGKTA